MRLTENEITISELYDYNNCRDWRKRKIYRKKNQNHAITMKDVFEEKTWEIAHEKVSYISVF